MPDAISIRLREDGPMLIAGTGSVEIDGQTIAAPGSGNVALCRCGASANKPYCDGTHRAIDFKAPAGILTVKP